MKEVRLRVGNPDDTNRDYLPERIKGSDTVVNENGNNSQPYMEGLLECHGLLVDDGLEDEWYVYVPKSYDKEKKTPLVFSMHGGMMTGWGQAIYTSWTYVADRDGFIVVFPNANYKRFWQVEWGKWAIDGSDSPGSMEGEPEGVKASKDIRDNHDIKMILALIEKMKKDYNIDEERIFMQGMSMGNMMTSLFARHYGYLLAGAAGSGAATFLNLLFTKEEKIINKGGALAVWQSRPELNDIPPHGPIERTVHKYNRLYWMKINGCEILPQISIQGDNNLAFYKGKKADVVYLDIKNRDHGQTLDDATLIWDYFFSGIRRRSDGQIVCTKPVKERKGDDFAFALADGAKKAWLNNQLVEMTGAARIWKKMKYHGLEGDAKVRGEYLMAPLSFLAEAFDCHLSYSEDKLWAGLLLGDKRKLEFARGSIGCMIDKSLSQMSVEAIFRDGELYISATWFAEDICGMHSSECEGVLYVTNHANRLSSNMSDLIKDIVKDEILPEKYEDWI